MQRMIPFSFVLTILATASVAVAAENAGNRRLQGEIRQAIASLSETFNRGDAKGLAALWTADGDFIGPRGKRIAGRKEIEDAFREFFGGQRKCSLRLSVAALRPLAETVVLVDAVGELTPCPEGREPLSDVTVLLVKRDGRWLIDSIRETVAESPVHFIHLKDLGWMVGDWASQPAPSGSSVRSTCDWTANGSFLIRKFSVEGKDGPLARGTEIIGYDPRAHGIRSWTFDADGGYGESVWKRDGDRWTVKYTSVQPDGGELSATHILTRTDDNVIRLQSKDRFLNGRKQPDMDEMTIKRCPPQSAGPEANKPEKRPTHVLP
jgi:uncharacterized protein (TIGR02246 family)